MDIPPPPVAATIPCERPQRADGDPAEMIGREREAAWTADRINLANCGAQHWVLIRWAEGVMAAFGHDM